MVVLDVHIEDMHRPIELATFIVQIIKHSIEASLFAGDHDVDDTALHSRSALVFGVVESGFTRNPVLESLRVALDGEVAAKHVEQTVLCVEWSVL